MATAKSRIGCPAVTQRKPWIRFSGCGGIHWCVFEDCPVAKSKADEYRAKALECDAFAQAARDPFIQEQMLEIAKKWRTMAAFEEKFVR